MKRPFIAFLASLLLAAFIGPAVVAARSDGEPVPRVVIVVGPSGAATDRYRAEARSAASLARQYTPDVTEIYSPAATWPAVRKALQGASLVIYMGHGNGWPSKYRNSLYPPSQNGFGLNPTPDGSDHRVQYFGEARIAADVKLAPNAIVLLNHLCYASGNSEPGVPEGTLAQARQRADNFAAGFIGAGAAAVVAEAYSSPNYFVKTVLSGRRSIDAAWRNAPSRNGNVFAFASYRSKGYIAQMDPERRSSGFTRSIVLRTGLASADVLDGARGSSSNATPANTPASTGPSAPLFPSLVTTGIDLALPRLEGATASEASLRLRVPYKIGRRADLPKVVQASVRWDPIDVPAPEPATEPATEPAVAEPSATSPTPSPTPEPSATPEPIEPPSLDLVMPERLGDVVAPAEFKVTSKSMSMSLGAPAAPGRYRLTITLHDADGVAYDAATQAMLPALIVRVTGDLGAQIVAPARIDMEAGETRTLSLWAANLGRDPWGHLAVQVANEPDGSDPATAARITGQWISLEAAGAPDPAAAAASAASVRPQGLPAGLKPGVLVPVELDLFAPSVAGDYLLVLDIVTPEGGSITAEGVPPTTIRVHVTAPAPRAKPRAPG